MGAARLLAKAWGVFCIFAGAYAFLQALAAGRQPAQAALSIIVCVLLFGAMGFLFAAGYGVSGNAAIPLRERLKPDHFAPGFNGIVFLVFAAAIFAAQMAPLSPQLSNGMLGTLDAAVHFAIPGQRALSDQLAACGQDPNRTIASAISWLLAFVFLGSALSRLRLAAGIVRIERRARPEPLGGSTLAGLLGVVAVVGIQFLFVGTLFYWMPCNELAGIPGQFLIGIAPLMLAYLIVAALTNLLALGPEA
jgi:hypothetical protein